MYTVAYKADDYIKIEFCNNDDELLNLLCSLILDDSPEDLDAAFTAVEEAFEFEPDFSITVLDSQGVEIFKM